MTEEKVKKEIKSEGDVIWNEIKGKKIEIFALPNITVDKYFSKKASLPNKLILSYTVGAAIPSLEECLKGKFDIELLDGGYVSISRISEDF
jgi:hypothetical protein